MDNGYGTAAATTDMPSLDEMVANMRRFKARDDLRKSRAEFGILSMAPCETCGRSAKYREGPPERIELCRCMLARLKTMVETKTTGVVDELSAIRIDVVG